MITTTAPAAEKPAVKATSTSTPSEKPKAAPAATASPLAVQLESAKASVERIAREIEAQRIRHTELERLAEEKTAILTQVESGELEFTAGRKALSDNTESIALLEHNASRRAAGLGEEYTAVRGELIALKISAVGALKRCAMRIIDERQSEVRACLGSWGGTVKTDAWPAAVADLIAADPLLSNLESARRTLDEWGNAGNAADLLRGVAFAEGLIAARGLREAVIIDADAAESKLEPAYAVMAFWPCRKSYDLLSVTDKFGADALAYEAAASSTLAGARRVVRVTATGSPVRFGSSRNELVGQQSADRTWLRERGYTDADSRFLEEASAWAKLD